MSKIEARDSRASCSSRARRPGPRAPSRSTRASRTSRSTSSSRTRSSRSRPSAQDKTGLPAELTADDVLSIEGLVGNIRSEQEQILAQLIDETPDTEVDEKSDYYFRLGELYAKQQRLLAPEVGRAADQGRQGEEPAAKGKRAQDASNARPKAKDVPAQGGEDLQGPHRQRRVPQLPEDGHGAVLLRVHAAGRQVHEGGARGLRQAAQELPELASTSPRRTSRSPTTTSRQGQLADAESPLQDGPQVPEVVGVLVRDVQDGLDPSQPAALPGGARDVLPGRAGHQERQEAGDAQPRRRRRTSSAPTPRSARPTRRTTRSSASTTSYAFDMLQILADLYLDAGQERQGDLRLPAS